MPEALTDGADDAEALGEAADCLSTALGARISLGEDIPPPSRLRPGQHLVAPDATMALKAALYSALGTRRMAVADLDRRLDIDHRQAARLIAEDAPVFEGAFHPSRPRPTPWAPKAAARRAAPALSPRS